MRNNIRECTTFKEFHNDPEFVFNQEAIVHFDNVGMVIVAHNDNLKIAKEMQDYYIAP